MTTHATCRAVCGVRSHFNVRIGGFSLFQERLLPLHFGFFSTSVPHQDLTGEGRHGNGRGGEGRGDEGRRKEWRRGGGGKSGQLDRPTVPPSHQHPRPKRPVIRWDGLVSQTRVEEERVVQSHKRVVQSHKRVVQSHKHSNNKNA